MKNWKEWIAESKVDRRDLLTQEQLDWCERYIVPEWRVDNKGEIQIKKPAISALNTFKYREEIKEFPVQFADVRGYFWIVCKNLTSLKGAPRKVSGDFHCVGCEGLTSLEGAPVEVGGNFNCTGCVNLTTLEGVPKRVGGSFYCIDCVNLTSLEGAPVEVGRSFRCDCCHNLTSLVGAPVEVGEDFYCEDSKNLATLEGLPKKFKLLYAMRGLDKLPEIEKEFVKDWNLKQEWKKSPLNWKQFIYGAAAKGRKFGL